MLKFVKSVSWYLFMLGGMMLLTIGCDDSPSPTEPPEEEKVIWENDETYSGSSKILLNAQVFDGKFLVAGLYTIAMYDTAGADQHISTQPANNLSLKTRPAMGGPFVMYAGYEGFQLYLNSLAHYSGSGNTASFPFHYYFSLRQYNPSYSDEAKVVADHYYMEMGAFNNQNQFLTVIEDTSKYYHGNLSFCLIDLNATEWLWFNKPILELAPEIKRIQIENSNSKNLSQIGSYQDVFLVSLEGDVYIIDSNGNMSMAAGISGNIGDFFAYHDTLYAVKSYVYELYYSTSKGYTWNLRAAGLPADGIHFFEIDDRLCFYRDSQIYTMALASGSIQELDNTGLEGNAITSVNKYDGKVWATTLSGMFTKAAEKFFTPKKSNQKNALPKAIILK